MWFDHMTLCSLMVPHYAILLEWYSPEKNLLEEILKLKYWVDVPYPIPNFSPYALSFN